MLGLLASPGAVWAQEGPDSDITPEQFELALRQQLAFAEFIRPEVAKAAIATQLPRIAWEFGVPKEKEGELRALIEAGIDRLWDKHGKNLKPALEQYEKMMLSETLPEGDGPREWAKMVRAATSDFFAEADLFFREVEAIGEPAKIAQQKRNYELGKGFANIFDMRLQRIEEEGLREEEWAWAQDQISGQIRAERRWRSREEQRREAEERRLEEARRAAAEGRLPGDGGGPEGGGGPPPGRGRPEGRAPGGRERSQPVASRETDRYAPPGDWAAVVVNFITQQKLDPARSASATAIGEELLARRAQLWAAQAELISRLRELDRYSMDRPSGDSVMAARVAYAALQREDDTLFAELVSRLNKLLD